MRVSQPAGDLRGVVDGHRFGKASVGRDDLGERRSVDELHDDEVGVALSSDVEGVDDVGMRELRRRLGFLVEAAHELFVGGILLAQDS